MSPEERRAFMESLTPEQRAQMRERWKQRRGAREAQEAAPPDGQ
jgi:Spy/CpxP family protein refolding chaperone